MTASIQATRISGTAPLAVLFDSTATTTTTSGVDTFRQISYAYNFGDDRGLNWAVSGQPKNTQTGGPISAHIFDVAGTYTVKVRATDATGAYSDASVTVTVANPDTFYATTKTICVSPASNFTGCPSGATQQTSLPSAWNGKRVLLHRGESFGDISIQDGNSAVQVGAYGTGAKPIVASVGVGSWRPATSAFATDITVMDLNVKNGMQQSLGSKVLFYRNDVHVATGSGNIAMSLGQEDYWYRGDPYRVVPQSAFYNAREIFFVENYAVGADTSSSMGIWGSGSRVAFMGNTFGKQQMHSVRFSALNKGFLAHNEIQGISADGIRHALKLHSMGLNAYADGFINDTSGVGGWASSQIVIANNLFGNAADNNAWTVAISPQNDQYAEGVENVLVENNRFVRGTNTSTDLVLGGRNLTYRGNTVVGGTSISEGVGHTGALPASWLGPYYSSAK
ncbi:MAG TPA: hypothetical protein VJ598_08090 [Albitalea sp.]|nr:hypothetical protein [Albitalea sp.]